MRKKYSWVEWFLKKDVGNSWANPYDLQVHWNAFTRAMFFQNRIHWNSQFVLRRTRGFQFYKLVMSASNSLCNRFGTQPFTNSTQSFYRRLYQTESVLLPLSNNYVLNAITEKTIERKIIQRDKRQHSVPVRHSSRITSCTLFWLFTNETDDQVAGQCAAAAVTIWTLTEQNRSDWCVACANIFYDTLKLQILCDRGGSSGDVQRRKNKFWLFEGVKKGA